MAFVRSRGLRMLLGGIGASLLAAAGAAGAFYWGFLSDLPDLRTVQDYHPRLGSHVYDRHGRPIGEFFTERRRLIAMDEIPEHVINAFVASEDSSFFEHKGIDYQGIVRAAWVNLRAGGEIRQGGSTITQQMVKGLLLSPERSYRRKIREMILAGRIEERFTKDEILYLYLNQIYFGHGSYGIGEAAVSYFGKRPDELSVSEGALLAGLPKAPSRYSPFANPDEAEKRRRYVLLRMHEDHFIDADVYQNAVDEVPALARASNPLAESSAYFVEEVRRYLFDALGGDSVLHGGLQIETTLDADLQTAAVNALQKGLVDLDHRQGYRGGLRQVAPSEIASEKQRIAEENGFDEASLAGLDDGPDGSLANGDAFLENDTPYVGVVTAVDTENQTARIAFAPGVDAITRLEDIAWAREPDPNARPSAVKKIEDVFQPGHVSRFERLSLPVNLDADDELARAVVGLVQEPIVQGALLSIDITSDEVLALVGGYDYEKSQFNRVTQARRQPGSAFKPLIYAAALDKGYTPASIVHDRPVVYVDDESGFIWRPRNYGRNFYGPITLREALARSVNNATVHLFRDVGVDYVIDYAQRLGIESPLNRDLSLALGSSGLTLLELTRAYAVFPAAGRRVVPTFIRRVTDRDGNVLLDNVELGANPEDFELAADAEEPVEYAVEDGIEAVDETTLVAEDEPIVVEDEVEIAVVDEDDFLEPPEPELPAGWVIPTERAYLLTDLLHAVVVDPKGTGWRLRSLRRPLAGKTGTTNDQADAWFMGFSPEIMTGVWVGHDESRFLGWGETGSRAAAPVWVDYMRVALANRPVRDFKPPEPIVFARIDRKTGLLAGSNSTDTVFQAFLTGTEPTRTSAAEKNDSARRRELRLDAF